MRYLSVCSGIEAATVAWQPLGWTPIAFSEIEAFPCAVLAHHYPNTPNLGDMERFHEWRLPDDPDVLIGGTPCQSFSVAGLRRGLADPRGNLTLVYLGLVERYRPRWVVWENVPGVLSADQGRAFGAFLGGLEELGYGWAYRTLDAQYFGLAQRRRRVFVVGCLGDWRGAASVLFEPESLRGDSAPGREAGERVARGTAPCLESGGNDTGGTRPPGTTVDTANSLVPHVSPTLSARTQGGGGLGTDTECDGGLVPDVAATITSGVANGGAGHGARSGHAKDATLIPQKAQCLNGGAMGRQDAETETLIPFDTTQITSKTNRSNPQSGDPCHTVTAGADAPTVAFKHQTGGDFRPMCQHEQANSLQANQGQAVASPVTASYGKQVDSSDSSKGPPNILREGMYVRRLTPRECERLQGFPDDYTLVPYRRQWAKDGPRYKALGNSMAVPVVRWIGERIEVVDKELG